MMEIDAAGMKTNRAGGDPHGNQHAFYRNAATAAPSGGNERIRQQLLSIAVPVTTKSRATA